MRAMDGCEADADAGKFVRAVQPLERGKEPAFLRLYRNHESRCFATSLLN